MSYTNLLLAIKHITPDITAEELDHLLPILSRKEYPKGKNIVAAGQNIRLLNFVNRGSCRMYHTDSSGNETNIILAIEGNFIQDYESLLFNRPAAFSIEALEETDIFSIDYEKFDQLLNSTKNWEHCGRMINQYVLIGIFKHVQSLMFMTPEQRYLRLLTEEPHLFARFSLEHIASYLGVKRESLSRIRKRIVTHKRI